MLDELQRAVEVYYVDIWVPYSSKVLSNALKIIKKVRCAPFKNSKEVVCKVGYPNV